MILNNKQKKQLKALANPLSKTVLIGKDGISDSLIINVIQGLKAHELIKVGMLKTSPISVNEAAINLASETKSEIVSTVGKSIVLYKQSDKKLIKLVK